MTVANKNKNLVPEVISEKLRALRQRGIPLKLHSGAHHKQPKTDRGQRAKSTLCVIAGGSCSVLQRRDKHGVERTGEVFLASPDDLAGKNDTRCLVSQGHASTSSFAKKKCLFVLLLCFLCLFRRGDDGGGKKKKERKTNSVCQLVPKMEDLVDSPPSVVISCTKSHKNAAGLTDEGKHPDTPPLGNALPVAPDIKVFETSRATRVIL